jgi:hypothetical protein
MTFHDECRRYTKDLDKSYVCVADTLLASYILLRKLRGCQSGVPGGWGEKWVCKMAVGETEETKKNWEWEARSSVCSFLSIWGFIIQCGS